MFANFPAGRRIAMTALFTFCCAILIVTLLGGLSNMYAVRLMQITALVTVMSLAPSLLVMVTAFTRIVIVLSLLRSALSAQGTPPNMVLIGLALFLTFFVMQPVLNDAWITGILPLSEGRVGELEGLRLVIEPFRPS